MRFCWLLTGLLWIMTSLPAHSQYIPPPWMRPVTLEAGQVRGVVREGVGVFKGIPFAAPPVGAWRWRPPQPVAPWPGVRDCMAFGPACPQPKQALMGLPVGPQSEDCLYLNVWTPARTADERLPVMVWIHGGGCTTGAGSLPLYDGEALARQGVVLVTINYRLGPFGFFAHPALSAESPQHVSGNYGFLDQIAALAWVQRNIAAFGGDPGCVTIFGESAGSASVVRLLVSPLAKGLFHRAIAQSGGAGSSRHLRETWNRKPSMEWVGQELAAKLRCHTAKDVAAALRAVPAETLLEAADPAQGLFGDGVKYGWIVDGWALPDDPQRLLDAGQFHDVPLLIGTNADEGSIFVRQLPVNTVQGYHRMAKARFGPLADAVLRLFPAATDAEVPAALSRVTTVFAFAADARAIARAKSRGQAPAYLYQFTHVPPILRNSGLGAMHGAEIPYVFGNLRGRAPEADRQLSEQMSAAWVCFATTGNPNGGDLPIWPAYSAADQHLEIGDTIRVQSGLFREACDLYDRLGAARSHNEVGGLGE